MMSNPAVQDKTAPASSRGGSSTFPRMAIHAQIGAKASAALRDQFERASVSIVLNIAEGAGRRSKRDKARFYSIARGSAMECGGVLAILSARQIAECESARKLLVRVVQMLSALERRMGP